MKSSFQIFVINNIQNISQIIKIKFKIKNDFEEY